MTAPLPILSLGSFGPQVGELQQALIEAGESIAPDDLLRSVFGRSTEAALMLYQHTHVGADGHTLVADGIAGPATWWALEHASAPSSKGWCAPGWRCEPSRERAAVRGVLAIAVGELGVCESPPGSNRGQRVDVYSAPALGTPWCAWFASWVAEHGYEGGSPWGRIGSAWGLYEWGKARGKVLAAGALPQAGDLGLILRAEKHGHVETICGVSDDRASTYAIGGNVGDAVRGTVRARANWTAIVRPIPIE